MADEQRTCCRWLVTVLHLVICLTAGACLLSVLLLRETKANCLPSLIDDTGRHVQYDVHILNKFCDVLLYAMGCISGCSLLSFFVHCCWENRLCFAVQTVVYLLISVLCLTGAASLTTQFLLWCKNLQTISNSSIPCEKAARKYDDTFPHKINMSTYYTRDIIQQGCTWSLAFLSFLLAFIYISLMCIPRREYANTRVIYVRDTENEPLLQPE